MANDDDARKSLLAGNRRPQSDGTSTHTYYDMQQPSSTTVSYFRETIGLIIITFLTEAILHT